MASLKKFKLLATQCTVVSSPTLSPRTSPVIHLHRRRKTLRMLLTGRSSRRQDSYEELRIIVNEPQMKNKELGSHSLKVLFVSSPPYEVDDSKVRGKDEALVFPSALIAKGGCGSGGGSGGGGDGAIQHGSSKPVFVGFRHRLLKRAWRPVLSAIVE